MDDGKLTAPEFRKVLRKRLWNFFLPALAITLSDPAMGLVDTVCIGQMATTNDLAALGPNTAIFNFLMNGLVFLSYTTLALISEAPATASVDIRARASESLGQMLMLGWSTGLFLTATLSTFSESLILAGGAPGPGDGMWEPALVYLKGRCWAMPAECTLIVCAAAMLAQGDAYTPCYATLGCCTINVFGDIALIAMGTGTWGAAWATVWAQNIGAVLMLYLLGRNGRLKPVFKLPSWASAKYTLATSVSLFCFKALKNLCFVFTQRTATGLGTIPAAAHQAAWSLWMVAAFTPEPVSQAAQAFIPPWQLDQKTLKQVNVASTALAWIGLWVSFAMALSATLIIVYFPALLTEDSNLYKMITSLAVPFLVSVTLIGPALVFDGVLLARKHYLFCAAAMGFNTLFTYVFLQYSSEREWGLFGVWWCLALIQLLRVLQGMGRVRLSPVRLRRPLGASGKGKYAPVSASPDVQQAEILPDSEDSADEERN